MHHLVPALVVFFVVLLFVVEIAVAAVLIVTAFAMMRAWLVDHLMVTSSG